MKNDKEMESTLKINKHLLLYMPLNEAKNELISKIKRREKDLDILKI